ncbi:hypothetical protein Nepgr_025160 [Nepenthes gracilis]|uniref:PGG domain-containing protein n=1 Tax=Nepenthes gracilis TaxID=150966 RepID=A0AAD3T5X9_NEPGR|nr:hypothetical protein Nepgr_025160 [Nepenthes gracilis]
MSTSSEEDRSRDSIAPLDADPSFLVDRHSQEDETDGDDEDQSQPVSPSPVPVPAPVPFGHQAFTAPVPFGQRTFTLPSWPGVEMYMWSNASPVGINVEARYLPLYQAALKGDWKRAEMFIWDDLEAIRAMISILSMTALHVAAGQQHWNFVEQLVDRMAPVDLEMQDVGGYTALHYAAKAGCFRAVKAMVRKNPRLVQIPSNSGHVPLHIAAGSSTSPGQKKVVWYLAIVTKDEHPHCPFGCPRGCELIWGVVAAEYFDIALFLIKRYPHLATACPVAGYILDMLAGTPFAFQSQNRLGFWESLVYPFVPVELSNRPPHTVMREIDGAVHSLDLETVTTASQSTFINQVVKQLTVLLWKWTVGLVPSMKQLYQEKQKHKCTVQLVKEVCTRASELSSFEMLRLFLNYNILANAAAKGIVEILTTCLEFFPDLVCFTAKRETLLQISIKFRQEKIFNLMQDITAQNKLMASHIADGRETALHFVARLAPSIKLKSVSGTALQMQREIQWFKAVENLVHPTYKLLQNNDNITAQELFTKEHKELLESGEKWMKDTANSCMLVATLIATVVFAAAFTVPGGNDGNNGFPIFLNKTSFMVFIVSDAFALFSSTTSILMFLSILTARYAEVDFLKSLPKRLIIGLSSLFLAIATMMIAFGAALSIVLDHRVKWVFLPVTLSACIPIGLFVMLQVPLFFQMVKSTYWSDIPWQKKG